MTRITPAFAVAAAATLSLLAGCGAPAEPEVVGKTPDPMATEVANAAPVELPPAILASKTYRCRDNSLVYLEFFSNNTANLRTEVGADPTKLTAPAEGQAYTAEGGYSVSGSGDEVTIARPGAASQSCHV